MVTASKLLAVRSFYQQTLQTLGYKELVAIKSEKLEMYGFGSDHPYIWLKPLLPGVQAVPTHVAIDAADHSAVDKFHEAALLAGGINKHLPAVRAALSKEPYYASWVLDPDGNDIEAVCLLK